MLPRKYTGYKHLPAEPSQVHQKHRPRTSDTHSRHCYRSIPDTSKTCIRDGDDSSIVTTTTTVEVKALREQCPAEPQALTPVRTLAVVMHADPLCYKPGMMRRWIEEDNKGVEITEIRWVTKEHINRGFIFLIFLKNSLLMRSHRGTIMSLPGPR